MAIRFFAVPNHVDLSASPLGGELHFKAVGSNDALAVTAHAIANTPPFYLTQWGTLFRQDVKLTQVAYNHFDVDVPYTNKKQEKGQWTWDFDTTGGTVHITHAKEERARFPAATAPDLGGVIGLDGDQVAGTDIVIPAMKINVQYKHEKGEITIPQAKFLASITGTVNSAPFLTFEAGEVLFLGARGSDGTEAEASVGYQFAMSANASGTIGGIGGVVKRGHDHAWIRYQDSTVTIGGETRPVRKSAAVYVDRVYEEIDLAGALGFGGT